MDTNDVMRLAYLVLLLVAVGGWFLVEGRANLGRTMRMALAWGLIFLGVVAGFGLWSDVRTDLVPRQSFVGEAGRVEVPRAFDGHYYLTLMLDGTPVEFVVDTGATEMVLSREDASRIGLDPERLAYTGIAMTANGQVRTARARVGDVTLGPIRDRDVTVAITDGEMPGSLLGMTYLQRFDRIEISDGRLILER
jgi:aspartyl protease family protein